MYFSTICKNPIQVKEVGTAASDAQLCSQQNTFGPTDPHMFLGCQHYFQISNLPPVFLTKTWNHIWRKLSQSINCGRKPLGSKCQPCHRGVTGPASSGKGVKQQRSRLGCAGDPAPWQTVGGTLHGQDTWERSAHVGWWQHTPASSSQTACSGIKAELSWLRKSSTKYKYINKDKGSDFSK